MSNRNIRSKLKDSKLNKVNSFKRSFLIIRCKKLIKIFQKITEVQIIRLKLKELINMRKCKEKEEKMIS